MSSTYQFLKQLHIPWAILRPGDALTAKSPGLMDLHLEILDRTPRGATHLISLTHYGKHNGDLMADPDMTIHIDHANRSVQALSYQNDYAGIYTRARLGERSRSLDEFLNDWLRNLADQGFTFADIAHEAT